MTESRWRGRGREAYALRPAQGAVTLHLDDAVRAVMPVLIRELRRVPETERDEAIDAAAEGYLAAHWEASVGGGLRPARDDSGAAN